MSLQLFLDEAEKLKRMCWHLNASANGDPIACWGGDHKYLREVFDPKKTVYTQAAHLFTLHPGLVADLNLSYFEVPQPISVFELHERSGRITCQVRLSGKPSSFEELDLSGASLFATPGISYPPFAAVCLYGSDRVAAFLDKFGLRRHQYYRARYTNVELGALEETYTQQTNTGLDSAHACDIRVGGWALDWWDENYYLPPEMTLIATTFRDSEPWYELVYAQSTGGFVVKSHIT